METRIIKNAVSPLLLDYMRIQAENSDKWNFKYPMGKTPFHLKHAKLEIKGNTVNDDFLFGLAQAICISIFEKEQNAFYPDPILFCGLSIKDQHREDNTHTDHVDDGMKSEKIIKALGILNIDWKPEWGGGFVHDDITYNLRPTDFILFDPRIPHRASDITCERKRIALDFTFKAQ
jgi:hypothetical protein